jgi:hypothetical protein
MILINQIDPFILPPFLHLSIRLVLSIVLCNISSTNNLPASIANLSCSVLDAFSYFSCSSSSLLVSFKCNIISSFSISACYLPLSSTTGIPFCVKLSALSI